MSYWKKTKNSDEVLYKTIVNSINNNKTSHSFIISTNNLYKIEDEWKFIVESLISDNPFTDNVREISNYPDLWIIDGNNQIIKKENVVNAIVNFMSSTPLEDNGKKILIIKSLENANKQSLNSLLKFLEEPTDNTHIIMTTNNIEKILPTIKSRSQIIALKTDKSKQIMKELEILKVPHANIYSLIIGSTKELELISNHKENVNIVIKIMTDANKQKYSIINNVMNFITKDNYNIVMRILLLFINNLVKINKRENHEFSEEILINYTKKFNPTLAAEAVEKFVYAMSKNTNLSTTLPAFAIELEGAYE